MVFDSAGLALNILTIGVTSLWIIVALLSVLYSFGLRYLNGFSALNQSLLLWAAALVPWFVAGASAFLLLAPELLDIQFGSLSNYIHWHHVNVFHILSWHGVLLLLFCALFLVVSTTKLLSAMRTHSNLRQLDYFSLLQELDGGALLIDSDTPQAFTAGIWSPRSYLTVGLRNMLSKEALSIVQEHELSHQRRRDPLQKYVFSLLCSIYPKAMGVRLNDAFSLALEQCADQSALRVIGDKTLVSKTILQVAKLNNTRAGSGLVSPAKCGFTSNAITLRIQYLLGTEPTKSFPLIPLSISTLLMIAVCTMSVDFFHHSIETLFSH